MDLLGFAPDDLDQGVEDESSGDTVGNAVTESHKHTGEKSRYSFLEVLPVNILKEASIIIPTMIRAGAVAAEGIALMAGAKKALGQTALQLPRW